MIIYFIIVRFARNNFYAAFSDDIFQYYPMMIDFVNRIKNGTLGFFNYSNYLGASIFADTYYVPLDPFTFIILLLSYIMPTEIAMSLVELLKLTLGSMAFMLYLSYKGVKPKWVHLMGILFFSSSGITCFSCFSSFTSLAFYLPMSLNIAYWFKKGKWYYVPLFTSVTVLYNYYLAYTVFAFMAFSILFMLILDKEIWYKVIYKTLIYVGLIILGLMFSMVIFLPSTLYILKSTTRSVVEEGSSLKSLIMMAKAYLTLPIELFKSIIEFIKLLFNPNVSLLKNAYMYRDAFVGFRYAISLLIKNRTIDGVTYYAAFFDKEVLYRIMGSIFVPSYPAEFYGYLESYFLEHASLYITGTGIFLATYVLFLKDYKSKVYKWMYVVMIIFMSLPFFSYIFSANLSVLYTRWVNVVTIPLLLIAAHALNETNLKDMNFKKMIFSLIILFYFAGISIFHHYENLNRIAVKNSFSEELMLFEKRALISAILLTIAVGVMVILFSIFRNKSKKFKLIAYPIIGATFIGVFLVLGLTLLSYFNTLGGEAIFNTKYVGSNPLYDRDGLTANEYMTFITVIVLILLVYFVSLKKKKLLIALIAFEFVFSACLSFGSPIINYGEEGVYKKTRDVATLVKENTPQDDMYRVYVDPSISNLERENLARFFNDKGTNQTIFHSFINASTDNVAGIIFDKKDEGQANKEALNVYSYYLNVLLGYKYVIADRNSSFENYDKNMFEEIYKDDNYIILEFKDFAGFLVYDKFITLDSFNSIKGKINKLSRMNFLNKYGIVEEDFY
nr:YfhO family protein [Gammaproteobacteria bacterium]